MTLVTATRTDIGGGDSPQVEYFVEPHRAEWLQLYNRRNGTRNRLWSLTSPESDPKKDVMWYAYYKDNVKRSTCYQKEAGGGAGSRRATISDDHLKLEESGKAERR